MKKLFLLLFLIIAIQITAQEKRAITVDDMWAMQRVGSFDVSPDGKTIVFSVAKYSIEENVGDADIYLIDSDGTNLRPLKNSPKSESSPKFLPNGKRVSYSLEGQIWSCDLNGENEKQLTDFYSGASGIVWANDGNKFLFVSQVYPDCLTQQCNKEKDDAAEADPAEVTVITELMFRHWDNWRGTKRSHLFLKIPGDDNYYDLTLNSPNDIPPIALGSGNDYNFSPDGKEVAFTMNPDKVLATSTNNEIYVVDIAQLKAGATPKAVKISESKGNDCQPVYSPDGKYIAFTSMARAGFEADKRVLTLFDRKTKKLKPVSDNLDFSVGQFIWSPDSKFIYFTSANEIYNSIFKINVETKESSVVLKERVNSNIVLRNNGERIFFKQQRSTQPYEIFSAKNDGSDLKQITFLNKELLDKLEMNEIETFWSEGAEGAKVQSILLKPPFFETGKKYPLIFLIHGGPQGHWKDDFHYRWNLQMFASGGYVVVAVNPRGSTGYGQKFTDDISQDWGGKVYMDLMNAYDYAVGNFEFIDAKNTFAAGASYGGYMINWIEGHTDRFNALVSHDGVYDLKSMYGTTEELWFPEWEFGGAPWENPELYEKWSPSSYVKNFKTPMLIVQGGMDFRVPEGQAFQLFTALQKMNVESKLLYFPKETHFILKPQNSKFWWNSIFNWYSNHTR